MRLYVSILAVAGLSMSACGKKEEPKPEPAKTEQAAKVDEAKKDPSAEAPKEEPKKEEPVAEAPKEEPKKEEPVAVAAADRTEGVQKALEAWAAGKYDETYANYTDDATFYNVGNVAAGELKGKTAIIEAAKATAGMMTETKVKAARIIEAGDIQIVEYVVQSKVKTKGADGAEVLKDITLPAAMVLAYNAEGKVTTVWNFQDDANLMQQIGAMPGLEEGFVAAKFPETTEIIKGEANPALAEVYKAFAAKMMSAETLATVGDMLADDFTTVDTNTGKVIAKADLAAHLTEMFKMFAPSAMNVDKEFSVGEYYITVATMTGTYKGGIEGVEAKDQEVKMTSLEISRIADGKFKSYAGYSNSMQALAALGLVGGAAEKPADAAAGGEIGVAECDNYLKNVRACLEKLPAEAKGQFETGIKSALDSWKQLAAGGDEAKAALGTACKQAVDASKQAMSSLCPDVKWE